MTTSIASCAGVSVATGAGTGVSVAGGIGEGVYVGLERLTCAQRFSCVDVGITKIAALAEGVAKKKKAKPVTIHNGISHRLSGRRVRSEELDDFMALDWE